MQINPKTTYDTAAKCFWNEVIRINPGVLPGLKTLPFPDEKAWVMAILCLARDLEDLRRGGFAGSDLT